MEFTKDRVYAVFKLNTGPKYTALVMTFAQHMNACCCPVSLKPSEISKYTATTWTDGSYILSSALH